MQIKVYDHDDLGLDDLMGSRSIPMDEVISKDWSEEILMLDGEGHEIIGEDGTMCRVRLDLKYTPHPKKEQAALRRFFPILYLLLPRRPSLSEHACLHAGISTDSQESGKLWSRKLSNGRQALTHRNVC